MNHPFSAPLLDCFSEIWYQNHTDHRCPHDGWIQELAITEPHSGARQEKRVTSIRIQILGAFHNGIIELTYSGVTRYLLKTTDVRKGHGDWLSDELVLNSDRRLVHRVKLDRGNWEFEAGTIDFKWTPFANRSS